MNKTMKVVIGWVIVLVVLTIFDLQISQTLINNGSFFGWFFEVFGEAVISFVGCISSAILIRFGKRGFTFKKLGLAILFVLFSLMGTMLVSLQIEMHIILTGLIVLLISASSIFVAYKVPEHNQEVAKKAAIVGVILSLLPLFTINVLKFIWGRQRFRSMDNPVLDFTPWYIISGPASGNEFMSLPSGHSGNSATVIWFTLLPLIFDTKQEHTNKITLVAVIWTLLVMVSRIVVGAHFATDVLFGATITFVIFYLFRQRMYKKLNIEL